MTATLIDNTDDYRLQQQRLAERKRMAQALIDQAAQSNGGSGMAGGVYMVGNQWGNVAKSLGGMLMGAMADRDQRQLAEGQRQAQADWSDRYANASPEDQQGLLIEARNKGLRYDLEQQFAKEERDRIEKGEQAAADRLARAEEAEARRVWQAEQDAKYKRTMEDAMRLKQTPTIHITNSGGGGGRGGVKAPSGYRYNEDGTALEPIPGGPHDPASKADKPLNENQGNALIYGTRAAQAQNVLDEVGSNYSPIKLDMARGAEKVPGGRQAANTMLLGANEQKVDQAQRNFINAIMRRESGAVISPQEFDNARKQYFPEQGDSNEVLKQKKANRELVIKGLGQVSGPQGARAIAAEQGNKPAPAERTVVKSKAEFDALPAGTAWETPDGKRGTK